MELRKLSILDQQPKAIGKLGDKEVVVYPPSPSRVLAITEAIIKSKAKVFEISAKLNALRDEMKNNPEADYRKKIAELDKEQKAVIFDQINAVAPIIVLMTAKPDAGYKWNPVLDDKDVCEAMSVGVIIEILDAYDEVSKIPDALKKITALSQ